MVLCFISTDYFLILFQTKLICRALRSLNKQPFKISYDLPFECHVDPVILLNIKMSVLLFLSSVLHLSVCFFSSYFSPLPASLTWKILSELLLVYAWCNENNTQHYCVEVLSQLVVIQGNASHLRQPPVYAEKHISRWKHNPSVLYNNVLATQNIWGMI